MGDAAGHETLANRVKKSLRYGAVIILIASALIVLSVKMYLLSPYPARQLSSLLSAYLHQPVVVQVVHASGLRLYLMGLSIADPAGFPAGSLLKAKSLTIKPHWGQLLLGRRVFRLIELDGLQLDLHKNSAGVWNFSGLRQLFAKPATGETLVRWLSIKNGSIKVNDQAVREISLSLQDLATKGSTDARIELTFQDDARNRYTLTGTATPGSDAAFDLNLQAPSLSLAGLAGLAKLQGNDYFARARGDLQLAASLRKGRLQSHGELGFNRLAAAQQIGPVSGRLSFDVSHHQDSDQARLESLDLIVDQLLQLHGTGSVSGLKSERSFEVALKVGDLDLQRLPLLLPAAVGRQLALAGSLGNAAVQLAGSARQGITAITGGAELRGFSLTREGRLWVSGLSGSVTVEKEAAGIALQGELSGSARTGAALESIQAPFTLLLSPKLKLQQTHFTLLHARLLGLDMAGRASYDLSAAEPFSASLQAAGTNLASITPFLSPSGLRIDSGQGTATVQASGSDPRNFKAALDLDVTELHGSKGQFKLSLEQGAATAQISRSRGRLALTGNSDLQGLAAAGRSGQARLAYRLADNLLTLENSSFAWDNSTVRLARLTAAVPSAEKRQGAVYYPLAIELGGGELTHKSADARGIAGRLDGYLARDGTVRWLEGSAKLAGGQLGWQGKPVAGPMALVVFNRSGARANLSGTLLGGGLSGDVSFNPFAPAEGAAFRLAVKGADLPAAAGLLPPRSGATITEGLLDGSAEGRYSGSDGLSASVAATGSAVTVAGSGKTLVSRAGISLSGAIAGPKISIGKVLVSAGDGIKLTADGKLENAFANNRQGSINFALAQAPFNSYIDAFINSMPRLAQEATVDGSLAAQGTLALHNGKRLLEGVLLFGRIRLDSPGQALDISDLDGSFPFSLDLSGTTAAAMPGTLDFSRDNYEQLHQQLERLPESSQIVSIGRIALGRMELGPVTLHVRAANGRTEIVSLRSSLYGGTLRGTGSLLMKKGVSYRGDLLLGGVSLRELCNRFPDIKGYISGRVNGIVSLYGEGGGISGLYGFVDLWANEAQGEKMLVSREFLQRLGGKQLSGVFFRQDIPYDRAEISALLEQGYLSFDTLDITHTNVFGVRDLNVSIAPAQNRIALDHLIEAIRQASVSGKATGGQGKSAGEAVPAPEFKWEE